MGYESTALPTELYRHVRIPFELRSSSNDVTVRTANLTLVNLFLDSTPCRLISNQVADRTFFELRIDMIELQHSGVRVATVYAWVRGEVLQNPSTHSLLVQSARRHVSCVLQCLILFVGVPFSLFSITTVLALTLPAITSTHIYAEMLYRLLSRAFRTIL